MRKCGYCDSDAHETVECPTLDDLDLYGDDTIVDDRPPVEGDA